MNRRKLLSLATATLAALLLPVATAFAVTDADLPEAKRSDAKLYLTAKEADAMVRTNPQKVLFLDVRTRAEVVYVGMPTQADANVPLRLEWGDAPQFDQEKKTLKQRDNPDFVAEVGRRLAAKGLAKDDPVILLCRSGDRSASAADLLFAAGYRQAYTVVEGFEGDVAKEGPTKGQRTVNGWKNAGLPWTYTMDPAKMYRVN
jgi:rhodanese-related sulfurtransferase